ncbi:MAG: hypothetical protein U0790_06240 [Isosphaeraceae bacterium]
MLGRAAIHQCWHAMPEDRQTLEDVERCFRRLVDRAFRDLREDADLFARTVVDDPLCRNDDED